ncbi:nitrogenase component 1 [Rhodopseudomonas sp. BR0M22]|uniref:nitrogenase component 1 n=1 Tax=Rhodopseudomonas sp. BR0M22 TaxID=2269369 RepID=UPI0013E0831C|nr:nitrogenase component 1 [Rhodopseudomonas sp. BR0M22]NEW93827.1 vanadium nitrogenase [Rhodopseudomonas sp. BR0M22]
MAASLVRPRAGCALHGALYAASAIDGVTPLVHATPGCGLQAGLWQRRSGCGGSGGWATSNLSEKHIVFGGASRLREQIKNTGGILRGELTVVMTGCPAEMIGDDVEAMAQEARDAGDDVLDLATAGFRGSAYHGYESFLKGAIAKATGTETRRAGVVNLFGLVPHQDAFWLAEIEELSRLIAGVGLTPNPLFGPLGGVAGLRAVAQAELSLSVSPWGAAAARALDEGFGIPFIDSGSLPVGAITTTELLERVAASVGEVDDSSARAFIEVERRREAYCLEHLLETLYSQGGPRSFAVAVPSLYAAGLARFLIETLGWSPATIIVTDDPPLGAREAMQQDLAAAHYSEDADEIARLIAGSGAEFVFGSALERPAAARLGVPLIECAAPTHRLGLTTGIGGFRGGVALLDAIVSSIAALDNAASS